MVENSKQLKYGQFQSNDEKLKKLLNIWSLGPRNIYSQNKGVLKGVKKKIRSFALWRLTPLFFIRFSSYAHQIKAVFPTILTIIITFF